MATAEWMFGDAPNQLARLNFMRWSGALPIDAVITQLEGLPPGSAERPIVLKVPAGVFVPERLFRNAQEAAAYLARPSCTAEWMFGDAAEGHALARLIPVRWSGHLTIEDALAQLDTLVSADRERPVVLKIPAGVFTPERRFECVQDAVDHINKIIAMGRRAALEWSIENTSCVGKLGDESRFHGKAPLLDVTTYYSTIQAIDRLNVDGSICPEGVCVLYSKRLEKYVLLYRADKRREALSKFDLDLDETKKLNFKGFHRGKGRFKLGSLAKGLLDQLAVLGDASAVPGHFDNTKLVMTHVGCLDDRYSTVKAIGSGVQGTASLVTRHHTGQEYVAKQANDPSDKEDITLEFKRMRVLRHPNCLKIVEFLESRIDGAALTVCEFARGGNLCSYMQLVASRAALSEELVIGIFQEAMCGVAYLHAEGCVHNDLKPENLLVLSEFRPGEVPRVVVSDYGLTSFVGDGTVRFGDTRYLSPENLRAQYQYLADEIASVELCPCGDVWSMGVTLYELLSGGILPFLYQRCSIKQMQEEDGVLELLWDALMEGSVEVELQPHCALASPRCAQLLRGLLAKDKLRRPTAQRVLQELRERAPAEEALVELRVQQHLSCQILLNAVMWRLPFDLLGRCRDTFERFDLSSSGRVTRNHFKEALGRFARDASRADEVFDMADINGDNSLEFNEFAVMSFDWNAMDSAVLDVHIQELLHDISKDGSGIVTKDDLVAFLGGAVDAAQVEGLCVRIDVGGEGHLSAPAVRAFLRQHRASALPAIHCELPGRARG